ncbi:hypothetical protein [uncultured Shimia sp.]|uniref:hypothetical protein n=1 Tax=uncultured Shimia sp. TaxID=573152 RepID=UPI00262AD2C2|nr:hypothetical protein [uncultured Shimia sp.]
MSDSYYEFQDRVARIYKKQGKKSLFRRKTRAVYVQGQDGYTVIRARASRGSFPWSGVVLVFFAFFSVKGAIMANMGPEVYNEKVSELSTATVLERFRFWTMSPDPLSSWVAKTIKSLS